MLLCYAISTPASQPSLTVSADGYARARPGSVGVCITTFLVGALSSINGAAGSYAEELPTLHIVGKAGRVLIHVLFLLCMIFVLLCVLGLLNKGGSFPDSPLCGITYVADRCPSVPC